ncbi:MAG: porin family protein [Ginsengibacter sp.]|jgi:hypothetical protein
MKKIIIVIAVIAFSTVGAKAQTSFGLKGGMTSSNLNSSLKTPGVTISSKIGFYGGAFAEMGVSENFAVQPEVLFALLGAKATINGVNFKQDVAYANIPVLAKYKNKGFFAVVGPQVGILLSAKDAQGNSFKEDVKATDFSGIIGAGYTTMNGLGFDARYQLGFSNILKNDQGIGSLKNKAFYFGVHYQFGKK